jgi:hypothetical protein
MACNFSNVKMVNYDSAVAIYEYLFIIIWNS